MSTNHNHHHSASSGWQRLSMVLILTALYMVAEVVGAWWTGSLALLADAGHMFSDAAANWSHPLRDVVCSSHADAGPDLRVLSCRD